MDTGKIEEWGWEKEGSRPARILLIITDPSAFPDGI